MILAAALILAGCATADPAPYKDPIDARRIPVSELVGLSPNEVRSRLGLSPGDAQYVSEVRETGRGRTTVLTYQDFFTADSCPGNLELNLDFGGLGSPAFEFLDGRLSRIGVGSPGLSFTERTEIGVSCGVPLSATQRAFDNPVEMAAFAVVMSPFLAVGAAQQAGESMARAEGDKRAAALRLGYPPPGGLDAYAADPPERVKIERLGPQDADITVSIAGKQKTWVYDVVVAQVRGGRVTALAKRAWRRCTLSADDALHC